MSYDAIVQRLQNIEPFLLHKIDPQGNAVPHMQVTGQALVGDLVINAHTLRDQIDSIAAQILYWGRLVATQKRVWELRERQYRRWRSTIELKCLKEGVPGLEKTTAAAIETYYRTLPEYDAFQNAIEEAEEVFNIASAAYEGFREKARMLKADVWKAPDGSMQRWSP